MPIVIREDLLQGTCSICRKRKGQIAQGVFAFYGIKYICRECKGIVRDKMRVKLGR